MTDNTALRSMMGDLLSDMRTERRLSGQRAQLPPPSPGTPVQETATGAGGSAATFAERSTFPSVQNQYYADKAINAYDQVEFLNLSLTQGWIVTDQGADTVGMASFRGGPSKEPGQFSGPQSGLSPDLSELAPAYH